jgi:hypothetical protein
MGKTTGLPCGRAASYEIARIGRPALMFATARGFHVDAGPESFSGTLGSCLIGRDAWWRSTPSADLASCLSAGRARFPEWGSCCGEDNALIGIPSGGQADGSGCLR